MPGRQTSIRLVLSVSLRAFGLRLRLRLLRLRLRLLRLRVLRLRLMVQVFLAWQPHCKNVHLPLTKRRKERLTPRNKETTEPCLVLRLEHVCCCV